MSGEVAGQPRYRKEIMLTAPLRASIIVALVIFVPVAAGAAAKPFAGPTSGWDHTVGAAPTAQAPRAQETWRKSGGELISYQSDAALSFDDTVAMVKKNLVDNSFKASVDADRKCDGRRAHEVELVLGTSVVRQVIVDDAPGVTKLTYMRPQGTAAAADAMSAITAYCST